MATTRTLLNKVLRGLRQFSLIIPSSASSTSDDYVLMVLQLLNEAKEEIEECSWAWYALRSTVTVTVTSGKVDYTLTSAADADTDTNGRSRLLYEKVTIYGRTEQITNTDSALPQVFDVTDSDERRLKQVPLERIERYHLTDQDETGEPQYFALYADADSLKMKIWPTPAASYTLKMRIYIPQAELSSSDITTTLSIPERPVWTRALYKANQERGEELGRPGSSLEEAADWALASAISAEQTKADKTVYLEQ